MEFLIVLALLVLVVLVVSAPLRRGSAAHAAEGGSILRPQAPESVEIAELDAAREAKYREIRDADLDHRTGKLSDADYEAVDQALRAEAIEILRALDRVGVAEGEGAGGAVGVGGAEAGGAAGSGDRGEPGDPAAATMSSDDHGAGLPPDLSLRRPDLPDPDALW